MNIAQNTDFVQANLVISDIENKPIIMPKRFSAFEASLFDSKFQSFVNDTLYEKVITLDFKNTNFIDSSGIGALVKCIKHTQACGKHLKLINLNKQIKAVLKMTKLEHYFIETVESNTNTSSKEKTTSNDLPLTHHSLNSKVKRIMDIIGSLVGLTITGILFPFIALSIKLDSHGPIFFAQTRVGWMGKTFKLYKFRTMVKDAEARKSEVKNEAQGAIFKNANDPRITPLGKFLRKTSIDELPQFWNVLTGNMSLVGTRPPTPDEINQYRIHYWQRLDVKPGITGEWQVNGRSNVKNFEDIIKLDLKYQQNWSLWYDIKLILKTLIVIFKKDNGAS